MATTDPNPIVKQLEDATQGLQMMSETDAPFRVVFYAGETDNSPAHIAKLAGAPADTHVKTRKLDRFFAPAIRQEDWMNEDEKATAQKFAALVKTLKTTLQDIEVVVWGDTEIQVAIIGKCEGGLAGLLTMVVET